MNRKYNLKLDLQFRCNNSTMKFDEFDNNTSDFFIRVTRAGELIDISKAIVTLVVIKPDNSVDAQFVDIDSNRAYCDLKPTMKNLVGKYEAIASITVDGETVNTGIDNPIIYEVTENKFLRQLNQKVVTEERFTLLTDMINRLSTIEISEEQRVINEAERILSEENRKIEEAERVEAELVRQHEEADRTKYDATRESNENIRKINEEARISSENARLENEANRIEQEANRVKAEQLRKDNYNLMTEDEERRRSEANAHKEAEALRVSAENTRVNEEAKRRTTEQARVSAENTRVSNENTRKANEVTRQTNETQRVEAETQRQNRYNSFIADAEANTSNFENYTNNAKVKEEERKSNELDRKSQETKRVSNEVERISNENTRKANEVTRIESEKQRADAENLRKEKIIEIQSDYDSLKKVIIDENASANLQNQINQTNSQLEHKASKNDLDVERKRIDSFTKLEEGSTTGDAELIDGRVGADGSTYSTLGEAIRNQIKTSINEFVALPYTLTSGYYINGSNGALVVHTSNYSASDYIKLIPGATKIYVSNVNYNANDAAGLAFYNDDKKFMGGYLYNFDTDIEIDVPSEAKYFRFTLKEGRTGKVVVYQDINNIIHSHNSEIDNIKNSLFSEIDIVEDRTNYYIDANGNCISQTGYKVSEPITVNKNTILFINATGYLTNVAILSEYVEGKYIPLLISTDSIKDHYRYEVKKDMKICVCSFSKTDWNLFAMEDILNVENKTKFNLPYTTQEGKYIKYETGLVTGDSYTTHLACTDYIDIEGCSKVCIYDLNYKGSDLAGLAFYDELYNFISGKQYVHCTDFEADVPANAKYIRCTLRKENIGATTIKVDVSEYTNNALSSKVQYKHEYKYDFEVTPSSYISHSTGGCATHNIESYCSTNYISLLEGVQELEILHNYRGIDLAGLAFYDVNKKYITGVQYNGKSIIKVNVPSEARYVRCTVYGANNNHYIKSCMNTVEQIITLSEEVASINNALQQREANYDYCQIFHKIAGIGDSLMSGELAYYDSEAGSNKYIDCYNYSWLSNLCKNIGATPVHYSSGGRTVKSWLNDYLTKMKSESPKPSAYYIALGTNDLTYTELGNETDCNTDNETFYGLYSKIINEVKTFNPNAIIFCCSLYYNPTSEKVKKYCNAIKYMAERYNCYYIDFINNYGSFYAGNSNFVSVGHFTAPGYIRVGKEIQQLTNEIIKNNPDPFKFIGLNHKDI